VTHEDTQNLGFRTWKNEFIFKTCNIVTKSEEVKTGPVCQGRHRKGLKDLRVDGRMVLIKI